MIAYFRSFHRQTPILIYLPYYLYYLIRNSPTRYLSLRSKRYQSSYCGKVRAGAKKKGIFFLLLSQLSRQTRTETLATQALIIFAIVLRWLDTVFLSEYLSRLSVNYVAINKDLEKLTPQLY